MTAILTCILRITDSLLTDSVVRLGIEAERTAVHRFAEAEGLKIASEYVETETGKDADALDRRPQLAAGLAAEGMSAGPFLGVPGGDSS